MRAATVLAVTAVASSGCAYKAGSFTHPRAEFIGQRVSVGCLDLAIERRPDLPGGGTVLGYSFGNRCDKATRIDLGRARVEGRLFDGTTVVLTPYDPRAEIRALELDGRSAGSEAIAYPAGARLAQVCVDAASIAPQDQPQQWLCFASQLFPDTLAVTEEVAE